MDYSKYKPKKSEVALDIAMFLLAVSVLTFYFYRSFAALLIFVPVFPFYMKHMRKKHVRDIKKRLSNEFSQTLQCVAVNMRAGYSIENAFVEAKSDLENFYGKESLMAKEITVFARYLSCRKPLEEILAEFSKRSGVTDIEMFADIFKTAKKSGGKVEDLLERTAEALKEKEMLEKELNLVISEKKMELRIMEGIPFFIISYIEITQKGYFDILYNTIFGAIFMTACMAVYIAAIVIGKVITRVEL